MGSDPREPLWMLLVPVHGEPALDCFPCSRAQQLPELVVLATSEGNKIVLPRLTPSFQMWRNKPNPHLCSKFWNLSIVSNTEHENKHSAIDFIILHIFYVKFVISFFFPRFLPSRKKKYNFFCLPACDTTKPHQARMLKSAKLPWFNMLFLLSNFSKDDNTLHFKEWIKCKRKSENTLHSRQSLNSLISFPEEK